MEIIVYSRKTINSLVNVTDMQKSLKKREGCKPAYQDSNFILKVDADKINKKWKTDVSNKIGKLLPHSYRVQRITLKDGDNTYHLSADTSNSSNISNLIANYILMQRHPLQIGNPNIEPHLINKYNKSK